MGSTAKKHPRAWDLVLGAATLLGGFAAAVIFLPRVSVPDPSPPIDSNNVLSSSFEVTNTGYIPLNDVSVHIYAYMVGINTTISALPVSPSNAGALDLAYPEWQHHSLGLDDKLTINPESQLHLPIKSADIAVVVFYRPWFVPITRKKAFRFVAVPDSTGRVYWRSWLPNEAGPAN